jgi:hypothetical protein
MQFSYPKVNLADVPRPWSKPSELAENKRVAGLETLVLALQ